MIVEKHTVQETGKFGLVVIKPSGYTAIKKYTMILFLAGQGGTGTGSSTDLDKLVNGEIPSQLQLVVDSRSYVIVAPQTGSAGSYSAGEPDFAFSWALSNLSIDTERIHITGLSLGAGGSIAEVCRSMANADEFATVSEVATTWQTEAINNIVATNLPAWLFHNLNDTNGPTPEAATMDIYNRINALNPTIKPAVTIFNATGHGGWGTVYDGTKPPTAPGGQGFTNATFTLYDWFDANTKSKPISVLSMGTITPPPPPTLTAVAAQKQDDGSLVSGTITTASTQVNLDGTQSQGYQSARWGVKQVPSGISIYAPIITSGGGWITGSAAFPKPGTYVLELTVYPNGDYTGTPAVSDITFVIVSTKQVLQKVFIPANNNYVYVYDDGSTETKAS